MEYKFSKDCAILYRCQDVEEIEKAIEKIFKNNEAILPKNKKAKILVKPNFNNDLTALTGNSTDLRVIIPVIKCLKKRKYSNIIIADGPNCGINHIGIDVLSRLSVDKVGKLFGAEVKDLNALPGKNINLKTGAAEIADICLDADFIINLPKIKTHVEAGMTCACKNYMGGLKGVEKRRMHDNLAENIVRLNEIIKTDLIIVDGLICMEGNGPGDGITKKLGILVEGHNPFAVDLLCSKLVGLDYRKIGFLEKALKNGHLTQKDLEILEEVGALTKFKPGNKGIFGAILLNNFFINIRFSKTFEKFFNKGFLPWFLFKIGVKQDVYINEERNIERFYEREDLSREESEKLKDCLKTYCPIKLKDIKDKKCIKCMYCYQACPNLIKYEGNLGAFKMQLDRFGKYLWKNG